MSNLKTSVAITILLLVIAWPAAGKIIFVDRDTPTGSFKDGSSWLNAFKYLQDGLRVASSGDEVRVAQGIYKPDEASMGDLDAFVSNTGQPEKVWLNDGAGVFIDSGQNLEIGGLKLGDVDGDGDLDAFVIASDGHEVWLNDGQGNFTDSGQSFGNPGHVELGDLDGDGDLDAFVAHQDYPNGQPNKIWLNDGQGYFADSGQALGNFDSYHVALGDVDGDGDLDAFVTNYNEVDKVWFNNGFGVFYDSGQAPGNSTSYNVALGDLDGDGDLDAFLISSIDQPDKVWLNNGHGYFADSGQALGNSTGYKVALGDVDGDGDLDAFVTNYNEVDKVWLNDGAGVFSDSGQSLGGPDSHDAAIGDVDDDGDLDAFLAYSGGNGNKVLLNDGSGNFVDSGQSLGDSSSYSVELGDLDGDVVSWGVRTATFQLKNDVTIKGGYAGWGEPDPSVRDIKVYKTVLSGDINTPGNSSDNSYHVVTGSGTDDTAVLDGLIITAGNANGPTYYDKRGGGIYNHNGSPTVINCIFIKNSAGAGAGMLNDYECSPTIINCAFIGNSAEQDGGGVHNYGLYSQNKQTFINCIFSGNTAGIGGGISNWDGSTPMLTNCILWGNSDNGGYDESAQISECNSITTINYSLVQGWTGSLGGTGNIGDDPVFKDVDGADNILGTEDDDLRLSGGSPCIDAGDNSALPLDVTTDLAGTPRKAGWNVDIGAYEFDDRPVAHWKLDEIRGNISYDSSGNGNHGSLYGDPNWQPDGGMTTGALKFDGVDDYVDGGNNSSFDITEEISLAVWVNTEDAGNAEHNPYVTKGDHSYAIKHFIGNSIEFFIYDGNWYAVRFPVDSSFNGEWHHLAGTYDGSHLKLYIDGKLEDTYPHKGSIASSSYNVNIGRNTEATDRLYQGLIDDVRIYNYALSGDEILWLLCDKPPKGDLNRDCNVNFLDFAILVSEWLDCGMMVTELCSQ